VGMCLGDTPVTLEHGPLHVGHVSARIVGGDPEGGRKSED
jgi:hypothetical protein